ncbi:MAG: hypothetical protein R2838_20230 [Caldilineaceae bacterium]
MFALLNTMMIPAMVTIIPNFIVIRGGRSSACRPSAAAARG